MFIHEKARDMGPSGEPGKMQSENEAWTLFKLDHPYNEKKKLLFTLFVTDRRK